MSQKPGSTQAAPSKSAATPAKPADELSQGELDQVSGGKVSQQDIHFTKPVNKSSPKLFNLGS